LRAIDYASKLESIDAHKNPSLLSHLHCEEALIAIVDDGISRAKDHLKKALKIAPDNVRVNLINAEMAVYKAEHKKALKFLLNALEQDSRFVPVFIDLIIDCFDALGKPKKKLEFLGELQATNESTIVIARFIRVLLEQRGKGEVAAFMRNKLQDAPKLSYLKLYAGIDSEAAVNEESVFLCNIIQQFDVEVLNFQCKQCGFSSVELNWCCPSCREWGTSFPLSE